MERSWEFPLGGPALSTSIALVAWVDSLKAQLDTKLGERASVTGLLDQVSTSAGEVLRIVDPKGLGPNLEVLVERIPGGVADEMYAFIEVNAVDFTEALKRGSPAAVPITAGYVFGNPNSVDGTPLTYSRGEQSLVSEISAVVLRGAKVRVGRWWWSRVISLPPYG